MVSKHNLERRQLLSAVSTLNQLQLTFTRRTRATMRQTDRSLTSCSLRDTRSFKTWNKRRKELPRMLLTSVLWQPSSMILDVLYHLSQELLILLTGIPKSLISSSQLLFVEPNLIKSSRGSHRKIISSFLRKTPSINKWWLSQRARGLALTHPLAKVNSTIQT